LYLFLKFKLINQINNFSRFLGQTERVIKDTDIVRYKSSTSLTSVQPRSYIFVTLPKKEKKEKKGCGKMGRKDNFKGIKTSQAEQRCHENSLFFHVNNQMQKP